MRKSFYGPLVNRIEGEGSERRRWGFNERGREEQGEGNVSNVEGGSYHLHFLLGIRLRRMHDQNYKKPNFGLQSRDPTICLTSAKDRKEMH